MKFYRKVFPQKAGDYISGMEFFVCLSQGHERCAHGPKPAQEEVALYGPLLQVIRSSFDFTRFKYLDARSAVSYKNTYHPFQTSNTQRNKIRIVANHPQESKDHRSLPRYRAKIKRLKG